jgi:succinyl-diaminopimelate desuccinylase
MINKELFELTKRLIKFQSISPDQAGCIDYIAEYLATLGFTNTKLQRNGTTNLIARLGNQSPIFAYAGHIDVVPIGDINKWLHDPFDLHLRDNRLYGRGIADMKGAVAAFLYSVKQFIINYKNLNGSLMILITSDEESTATDGTVMMVDYLQERNIKIDYCIIGEPTTINSFGDTIKVGRRGSLSAHLEIFGIQGHIAYPQMCKNPIHQFAEPLTELTSINFADGNEYFPPTVLQFSNLNSGVGVENVIPGVLTAKLNLRYSPVSTIEHLQHIVIQILNKHKLDYKICWFNRGLPFYTRSGNLLKNLTKIIYDNHQIHPTLNTSGGTSDGRFLFAIANEILEFGLSNKYIHQVNENILSNELVFLANIYSQLLISMLITEA